MSQSDILSGTHTEGNPRRPASLRIQTTPRPLCPETTKSSQELPAVARIQRHESHVRSRSATASPVSPSTRSSHPSRTRASSIAHHSAQCVMPRTRVYSFSSLGSGAVPKADAVSSPVSINEDETIGSFTPTSSARRHLHSLLGTSPRPKYHTTDYSYNRTRTVSSTFSPAVVFPKLPLSRTSSSESITPPDSPIPSICRTPPCYEPLESECYSTAPSSAGPLTPAHNSRASSLSRSAVPSFRTPKALAALEDKSILRLRTTCATCRKPGSNYPCCPRCGEMWCSRECRLASSGGKRHVCSSKIC